MRSNITIANSSKKAIEIVSFYRETKCGVDFVDQMGRHDSFKAASRKWQIPTFYNILDFSDINVWITFKPVDEEKYESIILYKY